MIAGSHGGHTINVMRKHLAETLYVSVPTCFGRDQIVKANGRILFPLCN